MVGNSADISCSNSKIPAARWPHAYLGYFGFFFVRFGGSEDEASICKECSDKVVHRVNMLSMSWADADDIGTVNQSSCTSPPSTKQTQTWRGWFSSRLPSMNLETAPLHNRGAHGPVKPNGRHHPRVVQRKQLPPVNISETFSTQWR